MSKTSFDSVYGGKYLSAADLDEEGRAVQVENHTIEKMRDGSQRLVITLANEDRGVVLNKTRAKFLCDLSGSKDYDDWIGLKFKIYAGTTTFGSETVSCVAFRKLPTPKKPLKEELSDDLPSFTK